MKQRILYLDVTKAIAITLVCIGHSDLLVNLGQPSMLHQWIYSFHMPLFMLVSGYFSVHTFNKTFKEFISSKALYILLPALSFSFLEFIIPVCMGYKDIKHHAIGEAIGGMWFLRTLFVCYLIVYAAKKTRINDMWLCLLSLIIILLIPHSYFLQLNYMIIFFWAGYWLRKYYNQYEHYRMPITIFSLLYFFILGRHNVAELLNYDFIFQHTGTLISQVLTGLSGSLGLIGIIYYICLHFSGWGGSKLSKIGTRTLGIYGVQNIVILWVGKTFIHIDMTNYPYWLGDLVITPLIGISSTIFCYYITVLLSKNKYTNLILFGGQYNRE